MPARAAPQLQVFPPPAPGGRLVMPDAPLGPDLGAIGKDPGIGALVQRLDAMSTEQLVALVAAGEAGVVDLRALGKRLHAAAPGTDLRVPLLAIHPGQTQLSFVHAKDKAKKPLEALGDTGRPDRLAHFVDVFGASQLPVVLGPNGHVVLLDGHHKATGLLMLFGLADTLFADALPTLNKKSGPLVALHGALRDVDVHVEQNLTHLDEDTFWRTLDEEHIVYLERRDRTRADAPRAHFSQLDDNPYRELAGRLVAKAYGTGKRTTLTGAEQPLWIKRPDEANFIEFAIGAVLEDVYAAAGETYAVGDTITKARRAELSEALHAAQADATHPRHEALAPLLLVDGKTSLAKLTKSVRL